MRFAGWLHAFAYSREPVVWADFTPFGQGIGLSVGCRNSILLT